MTNEIRASLNALQKRSGMAWVTAAKGAMYSVGKPCVYCGREFVLEQVVFKSKTDERVCEPCLAERYVW